MAHETQISKVSSGYAALLRNHGFQGFHWTQFLGAFNDNVYKMIVSVGAVELAANQVLGARYLALAGAVFVIPFLLFADMPARSPTGSVRLASCRLPRP